MIAPNSVKRTGPEQPARSYGWHRIGNLRWRFEFKAADCWVGVYWTGRDWRYSTTREVFICIVPMLPLHLRWRIREWSDGDFEPDTLFTDDAKGFDLAHATTPKGKEAT